MRLPGRSYQTRRGLVSGGHDAREIGHYGLAAGLFRPAAHLKPTRPLRPRSYPVGRPVLRQRLLHSLASARGCAFAEPPRSYPVGRMLRQCPTGYGPGRKLAVPAQNRGARTPRVACFAALADAQASIADYFDYYNHDYLHSGIGYQTSYHAHQQLLQTTALNCSA